MTAPRSGHHFGPVEPTRLAGAERVGTLVAPLPDNNTPVLFMEYTSAGVDHTAEVRLPSGADSTSALAAANVLRTAMAGYMLASDSITGARFRQAASTVSLPISILPLAGSVAGTADPDRRPNFASFTGRSLDGRRVRFTIFTNIVDTAASGYRDRSPSAAELAILNALQNEAVLAKTISGQSPVWQVYVNYGNNSYWQRKIRKTY